MNGLAVPLAWIAFVGALGGAVNAALADDMCFWPTRLHIDKHRPLVRPGLGVQIAIGALAAVAVVLACGPWAAMQAGAAVATVPALIAAAVVGVGASRWLTARADQRLLRAALLKAAAAPAAHPDTTAALAIAPPREAWRLACDLSLADLLHCPERDKRSGGPSPGVRHTGE